MARASDAPEDRSDPLGRDASGDASEAIAALRRQLGVLAHDFNNELLGILGNVGLAKLDIPSTSAAHESLDEIEDAAGRATALVRRLLAVVRPGIAAAAEPAMAPPTTRSNAATDAPWLGRVVLVVDDEALIRTVVTRMLEQLGVTARSSATAADALTALGDDGNGIDLVILDLALPDRSGESVLAELVSRRVPVRVLISSGFTDQWNEARARAIGAAGFLGKPFMRPALEEALRTALADPA